MSKKSTHPTEPVDEIDQLLTASELAIVGAIIVMVICVWVGALAIVSGYAWERWLADADFFMRAINWLLMP